MNKFELAAPCHFGLEAVLKREIADLGNEVTAVNDGRVNFLSDSAGLCRANIHLRTAERVLVNLATFPAQSFEELFQGVRAIAWEDYIPKDGRIHIVKAAGIKSKLFSPSDIQSIVKKAIIERLKGRYNIEWFKEDGATFPIRVFIMKDEVTVALDTTGESLHKRGYRKLAAKAPLAENLAAALLLLTPWKKDRILVDPFCGSGTFPIEAALMAAGIAPGLKRSFAAEAWEHLIKAKEWQDARAEAQAKIDLTGAFDIQGYDHDEKIIAAARENARLAGVEQLIHFQTRGIEQLSHAKRYGFIVTNPPYGERVEEENLPYLYKTLGECFKALEDWSLYLITAYEQAERDLQFKAAKNRKVYNGMLKAYFLQFPGAKPGRPA
jgi:putative N6-adenine-specific DNA methylase